MKSLIFQAIDWVVNDIEISNEDDVDDAYNSDESFMTATPFCLLPVTKVNNYKIGDAQIGHITKKIHDKWSHNVGLDIFNQIRDYSKECKDLNSSQPTPYVFNTADET